jgi:hypothetical protein
VWWGRRGWVVGGVVEGGEGRPREAHPVLLCLGAADPAPDCGPVGPQAPLVRSLPQDLAELEAAVGQQLLPLEQLGGPARALRAFRRLLFAEPGELEGGPLLQEVPRPDLLHHLYSRAPPALQSPHIRSKLTPAQVGGGQPCPGTRRPGVWGDAAAVSCVARLGRLLGQAHLDPPTHPLPPSPPAVLTLAGRAQRVGGTAVHPHRPGCVCSACQGRRRL